MTCICCLAAFSGSLVAQEDAVADSARRLLNARDYAGAISFLETAVHGNARTPEMFRLLGAAYRGNLNPQKSIEAYQSAASMANCDSCHADFDSIAAIHLERKEYDKATEYAGKAKDRGSPMANKLLSAVLIARGDLKVQGHEYEAGLKEFERARDLNADTVAYLRILMCYEVLGRNDEALRLSRRLATEYPSFTGAGEILCAHYYDTAGDLIARGDYEGAIDNFHRCVTLDPSRAPELAFEIGKCYLALDDTTQALVFLGNALFDRIYAPDAAVIMANIYLKKKRGDVSVKTLENALNVYPRNISAWNALSELFLRAGLRDDAIECSKVCAKFGDKATQDRLGYSYIPYDTINLKVFPWLISDPFGKEWTNPEIYESRMDPPDFIPIDRQPVPIKQVSANYPELARNSGLEGTVIVKGLITKYGLVKKVVVLKSDQPVFNEAAVLAMLQWRFTPARMNGAPIAVWAAVPFHFKMTR